MTNEELKKKIVEILKVAMKPFEYGGDSEHAPEIAYPTEEEIADTLILNGIGDVSELRNHRVVVEYSLIPEDGNSYVLPNTPLRVKQLYSGEEVENIVKERDEYKHRLEVAERALRNAAPRLNCHGGLGKGFCRVDKCDYYHCNNDEGCVKAHLQQAEKELAEEGKDG